nr:trypsin-like serine protease [Saccharopolyspora erythraea]
MTTKKWALVAAALGILLTAAPAAAGVQPKIVGGTPASTDDNPWMMWITDTPDAPEGDALHCGGTLVTPTKVVTAAHCVDEHPTDRMHVVGGRTDLRTGDGEVRGVMSVWTHPDWQHTPPPPGELQRMYPDVAVITLDRPMPLPTLPLATVEDAALYRAGTPARILGSPRTAATAAGRWSRAAS